MRAQSKTIIEMVDENDDVSSDEFLDLPGSLPRNSIGYDQSDQTGDPYIRNSALTISEQSGATPRTRYKGKKGGKDIKKDPSNEKGDKTCNSSCCEGTKCILFLAHWIFYVYRSTDSTKSCITFAQDQKFITQQLTRVLRFPEVRDSIVFESSAFIPFAIREEKE